MLYFRPEVGDQVPILLRFFYIRDEYLDKTLLVIGKSKVLKTRKHEK